MAEAKSKIGLAKFVSDIAKFPAAFFSSAIRMATPGRRQIKVRPSSRL
jgi:hypothetical protein